MSSQTIFWIQEHILVIVAAVLTLVFIYHYLIEKEMGVRLSKRYRNSIFEAQSKVFLNASQYLISGNKELAIKEFLSAVDINRETIETYFALGGLFRSNGEIEKAISIHRSLIARDNVNESVRLRALKELALDFDKGGFIDLAIETYKDVLKINRDQIEVVQSLCRIYEDIEDWDMAYNYRVMLSKIAHENQSETISHILVQKAKVYYDRAEFKKCEEEIDDAFRFAPSVSAKILRLKLFLAQGDVERSKEFMLEILHEHPMYASFLFVSLHEIGRGWNDELKLQYTQRLKLINDYFLESDDITQTEGPSVILSKVRILKDKNQKNEALDLLDGWMKNHKNSNEIVKSEHIKLLIELDKKDQALHETTQLLNTMHQSLTRHFCKSCGYNSDDIFWRCPQCHEWETIQFRWKV